ncbi:MAG: flagellar biosynthesis protein [Pseudomonadota bacterium]|nr:flagellar biosynthesis protein [Pseudomonadota bacterium]
MPPRPPVDQAQGLRRLFAHAQVRFVPVVSNPHVAFGGLMLERLCTALAERDARTLVVDASERANAPAEMALLDLGACIEQLSSHVSYVAARGLPLKFVDATGSARAFLQAVAVAAPASQVVLVHASAPELCRLFGRNPQAAEPAACPLLIADDHPASVTHAYAAMKLLTQRAGLMVHELMLGAAGQSPRAERIARQLGICADDFLGAVLRDWLRIDPATDASEAPSPALRRWVRTRLGASAGAALDADTAFMTAAASPGSRFAASNGAFN